MTVKDYIEELKKLPQDAQCVTIYDGMDSLARRPHLADPYDIYEGGFTEQVVIIANLG